MLRVPHTCFLVAGGGLSEGYGQDGPGLWPDEGQSEGYGYDKPSICLGDGQAKEICHRGCRSNVTGWMK